PYTTLFRSRKERGGVAVLAKTEMDDVEARQPRAVFRDIVQGRQVLRRQRSNLVRGNRHVIEQRRPGHGVVAGRVVKGDAPFVGPVDEKPAPGQLPAVGRLGQPSVAASRRLAPGKGEITGASLGDRASGPL